MTAIPKNRAMKRTLWARIPGGHEIKIGERLLVVLIVRDAKYLSLLTWNQLCDASFHRARLFSPWRLAQMRMSWVMRDR